MWGPGGDSRRTGTDSDALMPPCKRRRADRAGAHVARTGDESRDASDSDAIDSETGRDNSKSGADSCLLGGLEGWADLGGGGQRAQKERQGMGPWAESLCEAL